MQFTLTLATIVAAAASVTAAPLKRSGTATFYYTWVRCTMFVLTTDKNAVQPATVEAVGATLTTATQLSLSPKQTWTKVFVASKSPSRTWTMAKLPPQPCRTPAQAVVQAAWTSLHLSSTSLVTLLKAPFQSPTGTTKVSLVQVDIS